MRFRSDCAVLKSEPTVTGMGRRRYSVSICMLFPPLLSVHTLVTLPARNGPREWERAGRLFHGFRQGRFRSLLPLKKRRRWRQILNLIVDGEAFISNLADDRVGPGFFWLLFMNTLIPPTEGKGKAFFSRISCDQ